MNFEHENELDSIEHISSISSKKSRKSFLIQRRKRGIRPVPEIEGSVSLQELEERDRSGLDLRISQREKVARQERREPHQERRGS